MQQEDEGTGILEVNKISTAAGNLIPTSEDCVLESLFEPLFFFVYSLKDISVEKNIVRVVAFVLSFDFLEVVVEEILLLGSGECLLQPAFDDGEQLKWFGEGVEGYFDQISFMTLCSYLSDDNIEDEITENSRIVLSFSSDYY